jgi:uncharacterized protein (UPF0548 family)
MTPSLQKPSPETLRAFLAAQATLDFTYAAVGATAIAPPPGYVVDHTRIRLGHGPAVFAAARAALGRWDHFRLGWVEIWPPGLPIQAGQMVAVVARVAGLWWLNACRIISVADEADQFGFTYGTLPGHAESGEERFRIERDRSDAVWYDILAFSRPRHILARLGRPWTRRVQKRFARDSAAAMLRAVASQIPV